MCSDARKLLGGCAYRGPPASCESVPAQVGPSIELRLWRQAGPYAEWRLLTSRVKMNRPEFSRSLRGSLCAAVRTRWVAASRCVRACGWDCRTSRCNRTRLTARARARAGMPSAVGRAAITRSCAAVRNAGSLSRQAAEALNITPVSVDVSLRSSCSNRRRYSSEPGSTRCAAVSSSPAACLSRSPQTASSASTPCSNALASVARPCIARCQRAHTRRTSGSASAAPAGCAIRCSIRSTTSPAARSPNAAHLLDRNTFHVGLEPNPAPPDEQAGQRGIGDRWLRNAPSRQVHGKIALN